MPAPFRAAVAALLLVLAPPGATRAQRQDAPASETWRCGAKSYCGQMTSCAEAMFHLRSCGLRRLDADNDGIPCERLCGQGGRGRSTRRR